MAEVLEIEKKDELKTVETKKDTWILELPADICKHEGYADGTLVSLTFRDDGVQISIIRPSVEIEEFVNQVVEEEKEYFEEIKRLGD